MCLGHEMQSFEGFHCQGKKESKDDRERLRRPREHSLRG